MPDTAEQPEPHPVAQEPPQEPAAAPVAPSDPLTPEAALSLSGEQWQALGGQRLDGVNADGESVVMNVLGDGGVGKDVAAKHCPPGSMVKCHGADADRAWVVTGHDDHPHPNFVTPNLLQMSGPPVPGAVALSGESVGTWGDPGYFREYDGHPIFIHTGGGVGNGGRGYSEGQVGQAAGYKVRTTAGDHTITTAKTEAGHGVTHTRPDGSVEKATHSTERKARIDAAERAYEAESTAKAAGTHLETRASVDGETRATPSGKTGGTETPKAESPYAHPGGFPNPRWIQQRESVIRMTSTDTTELQKEVDEAKAKREKADRVLDAYSKLGFRQNGYAGRDAETGEPVAEGEGFVRQKAGRWVTYKWPTAQKIAEKESGWKG